MTADQRVLFSLAEFEVKPTLEKVKRSKNDGASKSVSLPFLFHEISSDIEEEYKEAPPQPLISGREEIVLTPGEVYALTDPVIVYGSWGDLIPKWLKERIKVDRLLLLYSDEEQEEIGTDSEALAYVSSASQEFPLDHDWAMIFQYLLTRVFYSAGKDVPEDLRVSEISNYQSSLLQKLLLWIYQVKKKNRIKIKKKKGGLCERERSKSKV